MFYWGDELRLGPLGLWGIDNENNTEHRYNQNNIY